jgi:hypothetical protein
VADVPESQSANIRNRSYTIGAQVDIPDGGAESVLFAHGSRFGGQALYIKDNRLHYAYNFVGSFEQQVVATEDVPAAPAPARPERRCRAGRPAGTQGRPGRLPARPPPHPAGGPRHRRQMAPLPQPGDQLPVHRHLRAGEDTTGHTA